MAATDYIKEDLAVLGFQAINTSIDKRAIKPFDNVDALQADTVLTYADYSAGEIIAAGTGYYEVLATGDPTAHFSTSNPGGLFLRVLPSEGGVYSIESFPTGTTEATFLAAVAARAAGNTTAYKSSSHFGIMKDDNILNYGGTRAGYVFQYEDDQDAGANMLLPAWVLDMVVTGNGSVDEANEVSTTIYQGLYASMNKMGDGSGHSYTSSGELGAYGPGLYNELGGFQASLTNVGSLKGTLSGAEMLLSDSPDSGTTSFSTKMQPIVSRIAKYNATTRKSTSFFASSEGALAIDDILGINFGGLASWKQGVNLRGATITSGNAMIVPNNTAYASIPAGDPLTTPPKAMMLMAADNSTYVLPGSAAASVIISNSGFAARLTIDADPSNAVSIFLDGTMKKVTQGALDSESTGFRALRVAN